MKKKHGNMLNIRWVLCIYSCVAWMIQYAWASGQSAWVSLVESQSRARLCEVWADWAVPGKPKLLQQIVSRNLSARPPQTTSPCLAPFNHLQSDNVKSWSFWYKADFEWLIQRRNVKLYAWVGSLVRDAYSNSSEAQRPASHLYNLNANKLCLVLRQL